MKFLPLAARFALLALLSGCGGGSSGSGSAGAPQPGGPQFFQPLSSVTVNVSAAADSFALGSGNAGFGIAQADAFVSTATVTTDANNNISAISLNISTGNTGFSQSFAVAPLTHPVVLADVAAAGLGVINGGTPAAAAIFTAAADGLSVSTFGTWMTTDAPALFHIGAAAGGFETPAAAMPRAGTAIYNGSTVGFGNINHQPFALAGNAQLVADFGALLMSATFSNIAAQNIAPGSTLLPTIPSGTLPTLSGTATIVGNKYLGGLSGLPPLSGSFTGTFYGSAAQETAGVWQVTGNVFNSAGSVLMGSFGAKR